MACAVTRRFPVGANLDECEWLHVGFLGHQNIVNRYQGSNMTVVLLLLALSALIGFGVGTLFRWPAIATSSVGIAVLSSAALQIQGFGALPGIAIVIACLTVSQIGYLAASIRRGQLLQEQAHKEPRRGRNEDIGRKDQERQRPPSATVS